VGIGSMKCAESSLDGSPWSLTRVRRDSEVREAWEPRETGRLARAGGATPTWPVPVARAAVAYALKLRERLRVEVCRVTPISRIFSLCAVPKIGNLFLVHTSNMKPKPQKSRPGARAERQRAAQPLGGCEKRYMAYCAAAKPAFAVCFSTYGSARP
jgi:hypothetical protein